MTRALLIVDVQRDFCEGGALGVEGGNAVAQKIADYYVQHGSDYYRIYASKDNHAAPPHDNCGHFALEGEPDFVTSWPVHCVAGTEGADLHPDVEFIPFDEIFLKGYGTQSYSALEGVCEGDGSSALAILRTYGITEIDVCGIATDFCVRATVLDALSLGFDVNVLQSLCAGVDERTSMDALSEMMRRGATIV